MNKYSASYTIIQYSPHPERHEFINVGVIIFDNSNRISMPMVSHDFARAKKFFKGLNSSFLKLALDDFIERITFEFSKDGGSNQLNNFLSNRVNVFQATSVLPIVASNLHMELENLYDQLVSSPPAIKRSMRVGVKLSNALSKEGVLPFLDKKPEVVYIEKYDVKIRADYGYQNGVYNLIDSAKFDESEKGLAEAGKRSLEGRILAESLDRRLVVVGDFGDQPNSYFHAIREDLERANTKLFRLDEIRELANEIKSNVH